MKSSDVSFVGIDVAKADFVVACRPAPQSWSAMNDAVGIATTITKLQCLGPALVVLESTGGYEAALVGALTAAQLLFVVVNPRQVRDFGKATGQLAKTDRLDAQLLALFAERVQPAPRPRPSPLRQQLAALVARRRQLRDMRTAEMNRLAHVPSTIRTEIRAHLRWLAQRITAVDRELRAIIERDATFQHHERLLRSVAGIGPVVSCTLWRICRSSAS